MAVKGMSRYVKYEFHQFPWSILLFQNDSWLHILGLFLLCKMSPFQGLASEVMTL